MSPSSRTFVEFFLGLNSLPLFSPTTTTAQAAPKGVTTTKKARARCVENCYSFSSCRPPLSLRPNEQRTLNKLSTELRCGKFVNKHQLSIQIGAKHAKNVYAMCIQCMQCMQCATELPICIPPLLVGYEVTLRFPKKKTGGKIEARNVENCNSFFSPPPPLSLSIIGLSVPICVPATSCSDLKKKEDTKTSMRDSLQRSP